MFSKFRIKKEKKKLKIESRPGIFVKNFCLTWARINDYAP